jgi:hypothetical protein
MWVEALRRNLLGAGVITDGSHPIMARLLAEREAKCVCNMPPEEHRQRVERLLAAILQASRRGLLTICLLLLVAGPAYAKGGNHGHHSHHAASGAHR